MTDIVELQGEKEENLCSYRTLLLLAGGLQSDGEFTLEYDGSRCGADDKYLRKNPGQHLQFCFLKNLLVFTLLLYPRSSAPKEYADMNEQL